jgi:hypothetical protein
MGAMIIYAILLLLSVGKTAACTQHTAPLPSVLEYLVTWSAAQNKNYISQPLLKQNVPI